MTKPCGPWNGSRCFEQHQKKEGKEVHHALAKELIVGFAAAEVDKLFEKHHYQHLDQEKAKQAAAEQAEQLWNQGQQQA